MGLSENIHNHLKNERFFFLAQFVKTILTKFNVRKKIWKTISRLLYRIFNYPIEYGLPKFVIKFICAFWGIDLTTLHNLWKYFWEVPLLLEVYSKRIFKITILLNTKRFSGYSSSSSLYLLRIEVVFIGMAQVDSWKLRNLNMLY